MRVAAAALAALMFVGSAAAQAPEAEEGEALLARQAARERARLRRHVLGMLVGSALGDALGAPTEMWTRERIRAHFKGELSLSPVIRPPSPEGTWVLNGGPGTTTDDTRWKQLITEFLTREAEGRDGRAFTGFLLERYKAGFERLRGIAEDDLEAYARGVEAQQWLKEWVAVSEAYQSGDIDTYTEALSRFYGGEMVCGGLLFSPVLGAAHPGDPAAAYEACAAINVFDIGYARDATALVAAMTAAALAPDATRATVLAPLRDVDPKGFAKARLIGRVTWRLADDARQIAHASALAREASEEVPGAAEPAHLRVAYDRLDAACDRYAFHAGEVFLVTLTAILASDWDFEAAMAFIVNYGRDNDTTAAVAGAILGAWLGVDKLPRDWVATALDRNLALGIDLAALAEALVARYGPKAPE